MPNEIQDVTREFTKIHAINIAYRMRGQADSCLSLMDEPVCDRGTREVANAIINTVGRHFGRNKDQADSFFKKHDNERDGQKLNNSYVIARRADSNVSRTGAAVKALEEVFPELGRASWQQSTAGRGGASSRGWGA